MNNTDTLKVGIQAVLYLRPQLGPVVDEAVNKQDIHMTALLNECNPSTS